MRFINISGVLQKARRFVSGSGSVQDEDVKDHQKLAEILRLMQKRISDIEAVTPPEPLEFEVSVGTDGDIITMAHNLDSAVRWSVVQWTQVDGVAIPLGGPHLVHDATSTSTVLALRSYVPGKAIVRIEPVFADINPGVTTAGEAYLPNQKWSPARSGASLTVLDSVGNFTTGNRFSVGQPSTCVGVRFYAPAAGRTVTVSIWNVAGTRLATATVTTVLGVNAARFTGIALTPHALYRASIWQTDAGKYYPSTIAAMNAPVRPFYAGGVVVIENISLFVAGDAAPTGTAGAEAYAVEPILF